MAIIYRYIDLRDNIIKYVGIVWANNRTLDDRIREHSANDSWCKGGYWKVEYLNRDIQNRMDAELLEAHYIGKFDTGKWYNTYKSSWGRSTLLDDSNDQWIEYGIICNTFSNTVSSKYDSLKIQWIGTPNDTYSVQLSVIDIKEQREICLSLNHWMDARIKENKNIAFASIKVFYLWFLENIACINNPELMINHIICSKSPVVINTDIELFPTAITGEYNKIIINGIPLEIEGNSILIKYENASKGTTYRDFVYSPFIENSNDIICSLHSLESYLDPNNFYDEFMYSEE